MQTVSSYLRDKHLAPLLTLLLINILKQITHHITTTPVLLEKILHAL